MDANSGLSSHSFNVLSLDGGGSKGVVTVALLRALERQTGPFLDNIHLFAGTSIGAANAAALASGRSVQSMVDFYDEEGCSIFGQRYRAPGVVGSLLSALERVPVAGNYVAKLADLFYPKWSNHGLQAALQNYYGEATLLTDVPKKLLMTSMKLDAESPFVSDGPRVVAPCMFSNFDWPAHQLQQSGSGLPLYDAVMRSMSAPVYFESHQGFVDGGMFANNPCLAAYAGALSLTEQSQSPISINLLSIGTGISATGIANDGNLAWGLLRWGETAMNASATAVDEFDSVLAQSILGDGFNRLNIKLPHSFALDDCTEIDELRRVAEAAVDTPEFAATVSFIKSRLLNDAQPV